MNFQNTIADYIGLVIRLRRLEASKISPRKGLGYLPDGLYGTFSGVSKGDRRAIVNCYRRSVALTGTCIAAAVLIVATAVTAMMGFGVSTPLGAVAVAATTYAIAGHFLPFGPRSSLTQIRRVMYGFATEASCARRAAD